MSMVASSDLDGKWPSMWFHEICIVCAPIHVCVCTAYTGWHLINNWQYFCGEKGTSIANNPIGVYQIRTFSHAFADFVSMGQRTSRFTQPSAVSSYLSYLKATFLEMNSSYTVIETHQKSMKFYEKSVRCFFQKLKNKDFRTFTWNGLKLSLDSLQKNAVNSFQNLRYFFRLRFSSQRVKEWQNNGESAKTFPFSFIKNEMSYDNNHHWS